MIQMTRYFFWFFLLAEGLEQHDFFCCSNWSLRLCIICHESTLCFFVVINHFDRKCSRHSAASNNTKFAAISLLSVHSTEFVIASSVVTSYLFIELIKHHKLVNSNCFNWTSQWSDVRNSVNQLELHVQIVNTKEQWSIKNMNQHPAEWPVGLFCLWLSRFCKF